MLPDVLGEGAIRRFGMDAKKNKDENEESIFGRNKSDVTVFLSLLSC